MINWSEAPLWAKGYGYGFNSKMAAWLGCDRYQYVHRKEIRSYDRYEQFIEIIHKPYNSEVNWETSPKEATHYGCIVADYYFIRVQGILVYYWNYAGELCEYKHSPVKERVIDFVNSLTKRPLT